MRSVRLLTPIAFMILVNLAIVNLFTSTPVYAASKEQLEMQRDIAQLQDQVRALQSAFDQKMAALQTLVEQALDAGNKANTSVSVLSSNVSQTLDRDLRDRLAPVAGLSAKVDNVGNDVSEIRNSLSDLTAQVNRMQQSLTDVNNQLKVLQTPPPPPPGSDTSGQQSLNGSPAGGPPVSAEILFQSAAGDYAAGRLDMAVNEFKDFLSRFPDDPNAPGAQENIGQAHMSQGKYDLAVKDFDAVLERYPDSGSITRDSWLDKGMCLKAASHREEAIKTFRDLAHKYPSSSQAKQAIEQLRAMGVSTSATTTRKRPSN